MKAQERYLDSLSLIPKEDLEKFLPHALLKDLEGCAAVTPSYKVFNAALLFLDVSGFSNIANFLQVETNEGSDILTTHLNAYFATIIGIVKKHGGDIILFSGDALLVMWNNEDPTHACEQTVLCGMALLREASKYAFTVKSNSGKEVNLGMSLHIGGVYGEVMSTLVGGLSPACEGSWKYVLIGSTIEVLGVAANLGAAGDFYISTELKNLASELGLETTEANGTVGIRQVAFHHLIDVHAPRDASVPWGKVVIDASIASLFTFDTLLHSAVHKSKGQLRTVSTVFIKLRKLDVNANHAEVHRKLNNSVRTVQKALTRLGGILNKVIMDDKGIILVCLFGVPFHSHEDDAERSCLFGLKIGKKLFKDVGETSIGLAKATVFCGLSGCSDRYEYTVLGDGVNLAARLMTKCEAFTKKKHMICDGLTAAAVSSSMKVRSTVAFLPAGELELKGLAKNIACFHVVPANDADSFAKKLEATESVGNSDSKKSYSSSASSFGSMFSRGSILSLQSRHSAGSRAPLGSPKIASRVPRNVKSNMSLSSFSERGLSNASEGNSRIFSSELDFKINKSDSLVCRKKEVAKLLTFCESAIKGRGKLTCCIKGGAQTGKTSFLRRAEEYLLENNISCYTLVGCGAHSQAFEALKLTTLRLIEPDLFDLTTIVESRDLAWLSHIVRDAKLGTPSEEQAKLPAPEKLDQVCNVVLQLMRYKERPVMLLVDDIQCVDRETQYFMLRAKDEGIHIIFTFNTDKAQLGLPTTEHNERKTASTASDDGLQPFEVEMSASHTQEMTRLMKSENVIHLNLFTEQQHYILLTSLFNSDVDLKLREAIFEKTCGVPGYAVQISNHLMESANVQVLYGQTMLDDKYDFDENAVRCIIGYQGKVMEAIDTLPQDVKDCLYLCSTLGCTFEKDLIFKATGDSDTASMLECLEAAGILLVDGEFVRFRAQLTKDAIYASMVKDDRQKAHRAIASVVSHIPSYPSRAVFRHLRITESPVPFDLCRKAVLEALDAFELEGCITYLNHMRTCGSLSPKNNVFRLFNLAALHSEMGEFQQAQSALDELTGTLNINPKPQKKKFLFCCGGEETVPVEEDKLVATVLWMGVEVAFMIGKKEQLTKAWRQYAACVPPSPEVASRDVVVKLHTNEAHVISRTNVNKTCPVAASLVFGLKSVMQHSKYDLASQSSSLVHDLPFEDTTIRAVGGGGRPSVVGVNKAMQTIALIFKGEHTQADEVIESIRKLPSPRWSIIGLLLKNILARYYQLDSPLLDRKNEVASAWASESEILSPKAVSRDVFLSPLIACTQYRFSEDSSALSELKGTDFITPMHALACTVLLDQHVGVKDTSPEVKELWKIFKLAITKYPLFEVAAKFFEGVTLAHEKRNEEADELFRATGELCLTKGVPDCFIAWRAKARLLSSPARKIEARFSLVDIQSMKEHIALASTRKLVAPEISSLQFIIDNAKDK